MHAGSSHGAGPAGQDRPSHWCHQRHRHGDSGSAGRCARVHRAQRGRAKLLHKRQSVQRCHSTVQWVGLMGAWAARASRPFHLALVPQPPCNCLSPPALTASSNQAGMQAHSESCHHLLARAITCPAAMYSDARLTNQSTWHHLPLLLFAVPTGRGAKVILGVRNLDSARQVADEIRCAGKHNVNPKYLPHPHVNGRLQEVVSGTGLVKRLA